MRRTLLAASLLLVPGAVALAQVQPAASAASAASPTLTAELSTYVTLIGGVLTGVATLLGIPIVRLNQRKTRAEIEKLELESAALRAKTPTSGAPAQRPDEGVQIFVDRSPNTTVQVLADPRFLAPLLLLLDFVFAWVLLTLAGHFLSIFSLGILRQLALIVLAVVLLLPIAKQAVHVRAVLRPKPSTTEVQASIRQGKAIAYLMYFVLLASSLSLTVLLFSTGIRSLDSAEDALAWGLAVWTGILLLASVFLKRRVDRYVEDLYSLPRKAEA